MSGSEPKEMQTILDSFTFERVLSQDSRSLVIHLLGSALPVGGGERAGCILSFERLPFSEEELTTTFTRTDGFWLLEKVMSNDIYQTARAWLSPAKRQGADLKLTTICPASEKHILKYSTQSQRLIRETPDLYHAVVEPYIESLPTAGIQWVYNILDGTAKDEKVLIHDTDPEHGFALVADYKWDQKTLSSLYLLAIAQARDIRTLRDLRYSHLTMLRKLRADSEQAAVDEYGVEPGTLRFFVHYQPTYYHFHVHVTHLSNAGFAGITVGQAHLLDDLIDELEQEGPGTDARLPGYMQRRTLTYALGEQHPLFKQLTAEQAPPSAPTYAAPL